MMRIKMCIRDRLTGPLDGLEEVQAGARHIGIGGFRASRLRRTGGAPQIGDDLGTGAVLVGREGGGGGAVGDALVHGPLNAVIVGRGRRHVGEGQALVNSDAASGLTVGLFGDGAL